MSAERLAVGDLVRCSQCRQRHPTLIAHGLFLEDLYHRLNTTLLDLRASTDHE